MLKYLRKSYYSAGAAVSVGFVMASSSAYAADGGGNNFGSIAEKIQQSIANVPGLISAVSYLIGILLGVLGIMKIKDHVENPTNTPLKDGAIRLAAGGALLALPIVFEAMSSTIGESDGVSTARLNRVEFGLN